MGDLGGHPPQGQGAYVVMVGEYQPPTQEVSVYSLKVVRWQNELGSDARIGKVACGRTYQGA